MESSIGARKQPLVFIISTAGSNLNEIGHEVYLYSKEVLEKNTNDGHFTIIYQLDQEDDYTDPRVWYKANPNLGVSLYQHDLEQKLQKAQAMQSSKANFLTKHMNIWLHSDSSWVDIKDWIALENPQLDIDSLSKYKCFVGLDLATRIDLASVAYLFVGEEKYYLITKHYIPASKLKDNPQYQMFHQLGHLITCDGNSINLTQIEQDIIASTEIFQIEGVAYDPYQSKMLAEHLEERGITAIEFRQTVMNMSPNMKILESWIADKKLETDNNSVMRWCVSNTVCHTDAKDNIYPRKAKPDNKIDGVVATIMAVGISQVALKKTLDSPIQSTPIIFKL
jgi:phage terminase large subunit-like protein